MAPSAVTLEPPASQAPSFVGPPQLDLVQALRGLAAFAVLTHHIAVAVDRWLGETFTPPGFGLGWVGVDLFFVLSGFIMVWTTQTAGQGLRATAAFWTRRIWRIYPSYWAASGLAFALAVALPAIAPLESAGFWASLLLWPAAQQPFLQPGWTLIYELWFYFAFGFLLLAPRRLLGALLLGWALGVLIAAGRLGQEIHPALHVVANPLTLNFLMGAGVALALGRWQGSPPALALYGLIGFGALCLLVGALFVTETGWNEWTRMLACGPASALVLAGAALMDRQGRWSPPQALLTLGDWSYALYLTHQPIVYAATMLSAQALGASGAAAALATFSGIALSVIAAATLHLALEKPAQTFGRQLSQAIARETAWRT